MVMLKTVHRTKYLENTRPLRACVVFQNKALPDRNSGNAFFVRGQIQGGLHLKRAARKRLPHVEWTTSIGRSLYTAFLSLSLCPALCLSASAAGTTIWTKASEIMQDVYKQILSISTIAAIVTAAVALLLMNFSRSGRTVDESRSWLKRIVITWVILNGLGFIMAYVTPFFQGGQWTPSSP